MDKINMVKVKLPNGESLIVTKDKVLRESLKGHFDQIYSKPFKFFHCRGMGTCGTCAVEIKGKATSPTKMEKWRLNFPPHKNSLNKGLRLLCQCKPLSDLELIKHEGLWGQKI